MARPATARRQTHRVPGRLDRPAQRQGPLVDIESPSAPCQVSPSNDIPMSTPPENPAESPSSDLTANACWALLPTAEREQFQLRLSRLVLKAARIPSLDTEENV
jgi:hypothetical protein